MSKTSVGRCVEIPYLSRLDPLTTPDRTGSHRTPPHFHRTFGLGLVPQSQLCLWDSLVLGLVRVRIRLGRWGPISHGTQHYNESTLCFAARIQCIFWQRNWEKPKTLNVQNAEWYKMKLIRNAKLVHICISSFIIIWRKYAGKLAVKCSRIWFVPYRHY